MPVFDATQNQVLFSPVSNYYKGKAIRQQLAAGEVDIDLKKKTLEQADTKLDNEGRRVDAMEAGVDVREEQAAIAREKLEYTIGEDRASKVSFDLYSVTKKHNDEFAKSGRTPEAMEETLKNVVPDLRAYADRLPKELSEERAAFDKYLEDGIVTAEEWRAISDVSERQAKYYGHIDEGLKMASPNPKDFTPSSWAEYSQTGDSSKLRAIPKAPLVTINTKTETEAAKAFGKPIGERAAQRISQAEATLSSDAALNRAKLALARGASTGFLEETLLDLKSAGSTLFGIEFGEDDTEAEILRKLGNEAALRLRNPNSGLGLTGNTSNKDLDFLRAAVFGLQKTEGGNIKIIDYTLRANKMKRDVVEEQARIIASNNGELPTDLDMQILRFYNNYQFFTEDERVMIEALAASNESVLERAGSLLSGDDGKETYDDGTTVTWSK